MAEFATLTTRRGADVVHRVRPASIQQIYRLWRAVPGEKQGSAFSLLLLYFSLVQLHSFSASYWQLCQFPLDGPVC